MIMQKSFANLTSEVVKHFNILSGGTVVTACCCRRSNYISHITVHWWVYRYDCEVWGISVRRVFVPGRLVRVSAEKSPAYRLSFQR